MSFLLDTDILSEWVKPRPDQGVIAWLEGVDEDRVFISVVTLAELRHGTERMDHGAHRKGLEKWLSHELPARFEERILTIDGAVADAWGVIVAQHEAIGSPIGPMDAFIAATARVHGLTVVTRNVSDFKSSVEHVLDPWRRS
ncbi:MAG TPA: type II toxin-antitoxin system VapC family toxin [Gammaproteobacteria bacterium]